MSQPKLRIYSPEVTNSSEARDEASASEATSSNFGGLILEGVADPVRIAAGDFIRLVQDAIESNRVWIRDFEDDTLILSRDFYEVLLAYQRLVCKRAA